MEKGQKTQKYNWIIAVIFFVYLVLILCGINASNTFVPFNDAQLTDYSQGWETPDGQSADLQDIADLAIGSDAGGEAVIQRRLPADSLALAGQSLNFRSKNINFSIYLDDQKIYDFAPVVPIISSYSYGSCFHHLVLPADSGGKLLRIEAQPIYADHNCFFDLMALGDGGAYYQAFMQTHLMSFIVCLVIIGFGVVMWILSFFARNYNDVHLSLPALGAFAIIFGIWSGMETLVPQMLTGTVVLYHGLNYLLLILLPYPVIQYVNSMLYEPRRIYTKIAFYTVLTEFIICLALNCLRIMDYHQLLPFIHAILGLTAVGIVIMAVRNWKQCRNQQAPYFNRSIILAFGVFMISGLMDLARYRLSSSGVSDAGYFMRFGILIFVVILFFNSIYFLLERMKLAKETEVVSRIAYTDALTGIGNRAAFIKREKELQEALDAGRIEGVMICQFDVNNLKQVNDRFGHAEGDRFICKTAEIITDAFGDSGSCYRIGGDEFTVFLTGTAEEMEAAFARCHRQMRRLENAFNMTAGEEVAIFVACGRASCCRGMDTNLEETERAADSAMYAIKNESKSETP
jgi:diguanylate cyclase (GGDEF)-like protein